MCAKRLATQALTRGSANNITVVVAFLQPVSPIVRIHADRRQKSVAHQMYLPAKRSMKGVQGGAEKALMSSKTFTTCLLA